MRIFTRGDGDQSFENGKGTPILKRSHESESFIEDSFFLDLKESETPCHRQSSSKRPETDSDDHNGFGIGSRLPNHTSISRQ